MFREGYVRTSSEEFTLSDESLAQANVHLTNNAVQKFNENYGKFEEGNILSFKQMQEYMNEEGIVSDDWVQTDLIEKMKE